MEMWKAIDGTNGMIEVSNLGNVRSLLRGTPWVLKTQSDTKGYQRIRVTINREKLSFKLHREVAKAFIPNPDNLPQVNHIDGNKCNNAMSNLEWVTNKQNSHHAIENGLWASVLDGAKKHNMSIRKPVIATRISDGETLYFDSVGDAERTIGTRHINAVIKGERRKSKGYTFQYAEKGVMPCQPL